MMNDTTIYDGYLEKPAASEREGERVAQMISLKIVKLNELLFNNNKITQLNLAGMKLDAVE